MTIPTSVRPGTTTPGPARGLVGLPDPIGVSLATPLELDAHLMAVEAARQQQLDALPPNDRDTVAVAYRANLEGILADLRAARARVAAGRYGTCVRCEGPIPTERLELRPWASTCTPCARSQQT